MYSGIKYSISIFVLLIIPNILSGQNKDNSPFKLTITQDMYPGPNPQFTYMISRNRLTIIKTQKIFNYTVKIREDLYSRRFNKTQRDSLSMIINKIDFPKLDNIYRAAAMDGICWTFNFKTTNESKTVILSNYYLPELELLIDFLNNKIPKSSRYISFDYFGTRERFKNK
jgi:hypothetical protein